MIFEGQVWFNFTSPSVWVFYQWVRDLAESGTGVFLDWLPLPTDTEVIATSTLLSLEDPKERGRFLHTMLGLVHIEKRDASERETVLEALRIAELELSFLSTWHPLLDDLVSRSVELGVEDVPSLYRFGSVLSIQLNPAISQDDPREVADAVDAVIGSDGIWELRKPGV